MKVSIVCGVESAHHREFGLKIAEGIKRCGDSVELATREAVPAACDIVIGWGWRICAQFVAEGRRTLVGERGYIGDRFRWTSLGWNGLNGRAIRPPAGDASRFEKNFSHLLKPWNPTGWYALLIGQVPGDAALHGTDLNLWYARKAREFARQDIKVRFRPHPVSIEHGDNVTVEGAPVINGTLDEAISGARVVVTFNSGAGVDAVLAGKPTIAEDRGSMAWPVTMHGHTILDIEPSRIDWAQKLAWNQFTDEELRSGEAWQYMTRTIDQ